MAGCSWNFEISNATRLCTVDGEFGYFHTWEQYSQPVEASLLIGGAPAGVFGRVYGLVEFPGGVRRVDPELIKFCDEENKVLHTIETMHGCLWPEKKKGEN